MSENVISLDSIRKKKMPTKNELLNKAIDSEKSIQEKMQTIQVVLSSFNKKIKEIEDKNLNDMMQTIVLIMALKNIIAEKLSISDEEWNSNIEKVAKKISEEKEKEYDIKNGFTTVDREVKNNDYVIVSFYGTIDDQPFEGGSSDSALIHVGSKHFLEDFENSLIGRKSKEEFDTKVKFPENYPYKQLANKEANFKIKVLCVKEKRDNSDESNKK